MAMAIKAEGSHPDRWTYLQPSHKHLFAESHAYNVLCRELRRYLANEVRGRSFLVAGHRGAGKTTLVLRAIDECRDEAPGEFRQRPLLVKLHGPSLLLPVIRSVDSSDKDKGKGKNDDKNISKAGDKSTKSRPSEGDGAAQAVLVQIAIALYRALSSEVVSCYRRRAFERMDRGGGIDLPELVGQLSLELDNAAGPALLRDFWARIGALHQGVLRSDQNGSDRQRPVRDSRPLSWLRGVARLGDWTEECNQDQGFREILAVSTAAQAFQVVSGSVTYKAVQKNSATGSTRENLEVKPVMKEFISPLLGLLTGGLVGTAAIVEKSYDPAVSVGLGLTTALATSLVLNWSSTRARERSAEQAHTFMRDFEVATLDRDLPIVIERIRSTGLAPVFVVDELDKVPDLSLRMADLVERLKHLVADYSFFCFLTDRTYFEELYKQSLHVAYPKTHTYFSHRLFLLYRPGDLHAYLDKLIDVPRFGLTEKEREDEMVGKTALSYLLLHRSMLHVFDLQRELAKICDAIPTTSQLRSHVGYRHHIMVQLAIESLLDEEDLRDRLDHDPQFGQLVYDALYMASRRWIARAAELDLSDEAIEGYLHGRLEPEARCGPNSRDSEQQIAAASADSISGLVGETDRRYLIELVHRLVELITEPKTLAERLRKVEIEGSGEETEERKKQLAALIEMIPGGSPARQGEPESPCLPLLETIEGKKRRYRWCRDAFGRELLREGQKKADLISRECQEEDDKFVTRMEQFMTELGGTELSLGTLAEIGVLRRSPDWKEVQGARDRLRGHRRTNQEYKELLADQDMLHEYAVMLITHSKLLADALVIGRLIGCRAGRSQSEEQTLHGTRALAKVIPFSISQETETRERMTNLVKPYRFKGIGEIPSLARKDPEPWIKSVTEAHGKMARRQADKNLRSHYEAAWSGWTARVKAFVETGRSTLEPGLREALCIAAGKSPTRALVEPVGKLSISDLSEILWAVIADRSSAAPGYTPPSAVLPTLHLLGLQGVVGCLPELLKSLEQSTLAKTLATEAARWAQSDIGPTADALPPSVLILSATDKGITSQWQPSPSYGALMVPQERLDWVRQHESILSSVYPAVQSAACFNGLFIDFGNVEGKDIESTFPELPYPLRELPCFIIGHGLPEKSRPEVRILARIDSLDEAAGEALGGG